MANFKPWQKSELNRLSRERICAGDHGLACDDSGDRRQQDHGEERPVRVEQKKRVLYRFWIAQYQRALPQIVENKRGEHDDQPSRADRQASKMAKVRIKRLCPGYDEKDGAKRVETDNSMMQQKGHAVP